MYYIGICDDEKETSAQIEKQIEKFAKSKNLNMDIAIFYTGEEICNSLKRKNSYHILFLDINLVGINGIHVGKYIREELQNEMVHIIYISNDSSYAMELFQVRPIDFLIKPIGQARLEETLKKSLKLLHEDLCYFCFQKDKAWERIQCNKILYFECRAKKIGIISQYSNEAIEFYGKMNDVEIQLEKAGFWNIHKSYIINSRYIEKVMPEQILMINGQVLPVSQKNRVMIRKKIKSLWEDEE